MLQKDALGFPFDQNTSSQIEFLLNYAIRAPSTHNSQPWLFKIDKGSCSFFLNPQIKLKFADPLQRDAMISMGACVENFELAAKYFHVFKESAYYDNSNLVAKVEIKKSDGLTEEKLKHMFEAILVRRNIRSQFTSELIPGDLFKECMSETKSELSLNFITDRKKINELALITKHAIIEAHSSRYFRAELYKWLRNNFSKKPDGLHGYSLGLSDMPSIVFPFLIKYINLGKKLSEINYKTFTSAPAVCVISSRESNRMTWFNVGKLAQKIMLLLKIYGLDTSIFSAALEIGESYKKVQSLLETNEVPHFLFCIGKTQMNSNLSPRYSVKKRMIYE